eukprot:6172777-Pleurochrysis_carterae.AAC.1
MSKRVEGERAVRKGWKEEGCNIESADGGGKEVRDGGKSGGEAWGRRRQRRRREQMTGRRRVWGHGNTRTSRWTAKGKKSCQRGREELSTTICEREVEMGCDAAWGRAGKGAAAGNGWGLELLKASLLTPLGAQFGALSFGLDFVCGEEQFMMSQRRGLQALPLASNLLQR